MRRPAKILLAGTLAAILPFATATSQTLPSTVENDQVQTGDVFADQTLDVVEVTDQTTAATTATGNSADFTVDGGDLDARSNQALQANVRADALVNVTTNAGAATVLTTAATGNTGDAMVLGGTHTAIYNQSTEATDIYAHTHVEGPAARFGDVSSSVQAIGNSQGLAGSSAAAGVRVNQTNNAFVHSDGGGYFGEVTGSASVSAISAANNVTVAGLNSAQRVEVNQLNAAPITQAAQFTAYGSAYLSATQATATGNNLTANEQGPILDIKASQQNQAYVRAQSVNSAAQFGAGSASAYGVGNSSVAGNQGQQVVLDNTQFNEAGGVEAIASYTGTSGYDGAATASAIGNAATGYACSDCAGVMQVANRQTNTAEVGATATTSVTSGRSANGVANAVGNTASYYVTRPNH